MTKAPTSRELRDWADNPAGSGFVPVGRDTLRAIALELDQRQNAYLNMRQWAEQNGLDTTAYVGGVDSTAPDHFPDVRKMIKKEAVDAGVDAARKTVDDAKQTRNGGQS